MFRQEFREQVVKFKDNEYCRNSSPVVTFPPQSDAVEIVELQSELLVFLCLYSFLSPSPDIMNKEPETLGSCLKSVIQRAI